jgi:hypothetical protein
MADTESDYGSDVDFDALEPLQSTLEPTQSNPLGQSTTLEPLQSNTLEPTQSNSLDQPIALEPPPKKEDKVQQSPRRSALGWRSERPPKQVGLI